MGMHKYNTGVGGKINICVHGGHKKGWEPLLWLLGHNFPRGILL